MVFLLESLNAVSYVDRVSDIGSSYIPRRNLTCLRTLFNIPLDSVS